MFQMCKLGIGEVIFALYHEVKLTHFDFPTKFMHELRTQNT